MRELLTWNEGSSHQALTPICPQCVARVIEQVAIIYRRPEGSEWTMCSMPDTETTSFVFPILEMRRTGPEFFAQVHSDQ